MKLVILESPFAGDVAANIAYARACIRDSLARGEAPIASHLLYTQEGILDDGNVQQRAQGMAAGCAWTSVADLVAVYVDRGMSSGMKFGIEAAQKAGVHIEIRRLEPADQAKAA